MTFVNTKEDRMQSKFKVYFIDFKQLPLPNILHPNYSFTHTVEDRSISSSITDGSAFLVWVNIHIKVLHRFNATYPMYGDKVLLKRF